jgi:transposase
MEVIMDVAAHHRPEQLQQLYRREKNSRLARRIQGVYLANKGLTCKQIMEITGSARRTIQQWIVKYNARGIEALKELPRPGQPTKLPRNKEQHFCRRIEAGPSKEDGVAALGGLSIQRILEREFGVVYSLWGVYDLLERLNYSCLCPRPQHEEADPGLQEEFKKTSSKRWIKSNQSIPAKK